MEKIIVRDLTGTFEFKGPTLTLIAYDKDDNLVDYCVLEENK